MQTLGLIITIASIALCAGLILARHLTRIARSRSDRHGDWLEAEDACWSGFISDEELAAEREYLDGREQPSPVVRRGRIGATDLRLRDPIHGEATKL